MGDRLKGKAALVTGAGRGIGSGVALALAAEGASVVVADLGGGKDGSGSSAGPADEVVSEIKKAGGKAVANYNSVTDFNAAGDMVKACIDNFGKIDILVNVAGILRDRMVFNMAPEEWDAVLKVHLYGTFNTLRHAASLMRAQRSGRIINFSSRAAFGNLGQANYSAAKGGIISITRTAALELGRYGVTVNCILPVAGTRLMLTPEVLAAKEKRAAAGVQVTVSAGDADLPPPEDVAPIVVFLASDAASDVNGQLFFAAGGEITLYSWPTPVKSIFKEGRWTIDELIKLFPQSLGKGLANPAPSQLPKA